MSEHSQPPEHVAADAPTCATCGEVLGIYEPIVVVVDGLARETSRAAGSAALVGVAEAHHRACFQSRN